MDDLRTIKISVEGDLLRFELPENIDIEKDLQLLSEAVFMYIKNYKSGEIDEANMLVTFLTSLNDKFEYLPLFIDKEPNLN